MSIKGNLISGADFYFNGEFEGSIQAVNSLVTLGPNSKIVGNIRARRVIVSGSVLGDVLAVEQIALRAGSRLDGNLSCARICLEDGSYFQGKVDIRESGPGNGEAKITVLKERYSKLVEAKYVRGLTTLEEGELDGVYRDLIAVDGEFYGLFLGRSA